MDRRTLRALVFDALRPTRNTYFEELLEGVREAAANREAFPSREECEARGEKAWPQYRQHQLAPPDKTAILEIVWDLIAERVLTPGHDANNPDWPNLRLTEFGQALLHGTVPAYYDDDEYLAALRSFVPALDPIVEQYALEGARAFRRQLLFAAAVMFGAAAEKAVLDLLGRIGQYETDARRKKQVAGLLERPRLPDIFDAVRETVRRLADSKTLPYVVHQGSNEHLLSLFEMIRVQRNDAVHPTAGHVNREKVLLTMQSLPEALAASHRLAAWFLTNECSQ